MHSSRGIFLLKFLVDSRYSGWFWEGMTHLKVLWYINRYQMRCIVSVFWHLKAKQHELEQADEHMMDNLNQPSIFLAMVFGSVVNPSWYAGGSLLSSFGDTACWLAVSSWFWATGDDRNRKDLERKYRLQPSLYIRMIIRTMKRRQATDPRAIPVMVSVRRVFAVVKCLVQFVPFLSQENPILTFTNAND